MRSIACVALWSLLVVGMSLASSGCGASAQQDRCRSSSGMPQGEMPCYEPPPNSPQRKKDDDKYSPPGNPMPSH